MGSSSAGTKWFAHVPPLETRAAMTSFVVAVALLGVKFVAYFLTGSAAIFSDAMESIVNVLASGVALYSLSLAHTPADPEHPYGHGKVEFMSAAFEGGMVLLAAIVIVFQTVANMIRGHLEIEKIGTGFVLMVIATVVNGAVGAWLIALGKRRQSILLEADGKHLAADAITSITAIAALAIVQRTGWTYADSIAALIVAVYICWMAARLLRQSAAGLMDEQDLQDEALIKSILDSHLAPSGKAPHICSYHKLRHRHSGRYHWVDFHIMVPPDLDIRQGHETASAIEGEIERAIGEGDATAHVEPCADPKCPACINSSK